MDYCSIIEPVVNLREKPVPGKATYSHDSLQETQLLFHEMVLVKDREKEWCFVEAVEQETFRRNGRWQGYPGWVETKCLGPVPGGPASKSWTVTSPRVPVYEDPSAKEGYLFSLSFGTKVNTAPEGRIRDEYLPVDTGPGRRGWLSADCLRMAEQPTDEEGWRKDVVAAARLFLGVPYLWGGRSMHMPDLDSVATGVDCSGLIDLLFRAHGIDLPRDAHEQWMKTGRISEDSLKPGDLIFAGPHEREVIHVMLFTGGETFIEALESGSAVRTSTFRDRFGVDRAGLRNLGKAGGRSVISFGRAPLWP